MEWLETLSKGVGWLAGIVTGLAGIAGVGVKAWRAWYPARAEQPPTRAVLVDGPRGSALGHASGARPAWPVWAWVLVGVGLLWLLFAGLLATNIAFTARAPATPATPTTEAPRPSLVGRWATTDRGLRGEHLFVTFRADGWMEMNGELKGRYAQQGDVLQFYDGYGNLVEQGRVVWAHGDQMSFHVTRSVLPQRNGGTVLYTRQG